MVQSYDWSLLDCDVIENKLACLGNNLVSAIDALALIKTISIKNKTRPPWINAELTQLYHKHDTLRRRYRRTKDSRLREDYLELASQPEHLAERARSDYLQNRIFQALQDNKNIWKELRSIGLLPTIKEELHGFTPNELNAHFAGVSVTQNECDEDLERVIASAAAERFTFKEITPVDVVLAVSHFSSQVVEEDGIPQSVVVKALPTISSIVTHIFNNSLTSGIFPGSCRKAHFVPLKKTSAPSTVSDFRPIALLSFLSKVPEKIVHSQISETLKVTSS